MVRCTIAILTICTIFMIVWDCAMAINSTPGDTISECLRSLNKASGGLLALVIAAIYIHIFFVNFLPPDWK